MNARKAEKVPVDFFGTKISIQEVNNPVNDIWRFNKEYPDDECWEEEPEDGLCPTCHNQGVVMVCFDDVCVGRGECMHGDGEEPCPDCGGEAIHW